MNRFPVVPLVGLGADSLGTYLASLGLLSLLTRKWPSIRVAWRDNVFCLVGGPDTLCQVVAFITEIGRKNSWTKYDRPWNSAKKADVRKRQSAQTASWRSSEAEEGVLRAFGAHLALDDRIRMNPLLGTGGNTGKRDFEAGWKKAIQEIEAPSGKKGRDAINNDLKAFLSGEACTYLGSFSAGSWFGAANKIYNHGTAKPFREGEVTPWAMALACEGLPYFSGGVSRQLGSRRQPKGAFPFITAALAPHGPGEAGKVDAEVWAPIWDQPMTEPELRSLFLRGRAEVGGKGAITAAAFAVSAMRRGVDAGIMEFRRFLLIHTTSARTFESRLASVIPVRRTSLDDASSNAIQAIVEFKDKLPEDRKDGGRWRFYGLRGPLEQALIDFASTKSDAASNEQSWKLVDEVFKALVKVDRNRSFRRSKVRFQMLPSAWAATLLLHGDPPDQEARLALALSSLSKSKHCSPFIAHRIGVQWNNGRWEFPDSPPTRRVWSDAEITASLCAIAERRTLEALQDAVSSPPFNGKIRVDLNDIYSWLSGDMDEERLDRWLARFCMFDWNDDKDGRSIKELQRSFPKGRPTIDGVLALYAFFRPLASRWLFQKILGESVVPVDRISTSASFGRIVALLRHGDLNSAVEVALAAYNSAGIALADFGMFPDRYNADRLLAALVIPALDTQTSNVFERWRVPT